MSARTAPLESDLPAFGGLPATNFCQVSSWPTPAVDTLWTINMCPISIVWSGNNAIQIRGWTQQTAHIHRLHMSSGRVVTIVDNRFRRRPKPFPPQLRTKLTKRVALFAPNAFIKLHTSAYRLLRAGFVRLEHLHRTAVHRAKAVLICVPVLSTRQIRKTISCARARDPRSPFPLRARLILSAASTDATLPPAASGRAH
jgi:hypothetical protein